MKKIPALIIIWVVLSFMVIFIVFAIRLPNENEQSWFNIMNSDKGGFILREHTSEGQHRNLTIYGTNGILMVINETRVLILSDLNVTGNIYMNNSVVNSSISLDGYNKSINLNNYYTNRSGIIINETGFYYNNQKITNYLTICRDEFGNKPELNLSCNRVCRDNDCSQEMQEIIQKNKSIVIYEGNYNFQTDINITSNISIFGIGNVILNVSENFNINPLNDNLYNFKVIGLKFISNLPAKHDFIFNLTELDNGGNIVFDDIEIRNWNATSVFAINLKTSSSGKIIDVLFNNIRFYETNGGIRMIESGTERYDKFENVEIKNIYFDNNKYYDEFNKQTGDGININGAKNLKILNTYFTKASDRQVLRITRSDIVNIENVYSFRQQDYLVGILDGDTNVHIKNVVTDHPRHWGSLLIQTENFVDKIENIFAEGLVCLNCSQGTQEPDIMIKSLFANSSPIRNIKISDFYLNQSHALGAIYFEAGRGNIEGVTIMDGIIENTDNAGIAFYGRNFTKYVEIDNVKFIDNGLNPTDTDKQSGILISYANVTQSTFSNNFFINKTAGVLLQGLRLLGDSSQPNSEVQVTLINNNQEGIKNLYTFYSDNVKVLNQIYNPNELILAGTPSISVSIFGSFNATYINATEIRVNGAIVNRSISLDLYNKSVSLDSYNKSISLNNYNQSISLNNYALTSSLAIYLTNSTDINITKLNVFSINGTSLDSFNKSVSLDLYNKSISLNNYNQSVSLDTYNKSISLDNYIAGSNASVSLWNLSGSNIFPRLITGNVGIGTTSPSDNLHVLGSARIVVNDTNNISTTNVLTLDHFTQTPLNSTGGIGVGVLLRAIDNGSNVDNIALINATLVNALNGSEDSAIGFYTRTSGGVLTPRLFINGSNVGIGTTGPNAPLYITSTGSGATLRLQGTGSYEPVIDFTTGTPNTGMQILRQTTLSNFWALKTVTSGDSLGLYTDNNMMNGLYIKTGGSVGIGNIVPNATLDVSGNIYLSAPNPMINISGMTLKKSGNDIVISD